MRPWALLPALLLLLAGCGAPGDGGSEPLPPEWLGHDLRKAGWSNETVQPGWTVAFQYDWSAGRRVEWEYVTVAPQPPPYLHFQLVRMDGANPSTAQPVASEDARDGAGERTVVQSGTHQLDWMNEWTQPLTVAVKVPAGATKVLYEPGKGPGCLFAPGTDAARGTDCLRWPLP